MATTRPIRIPQYSQRSVAQGTPTPNLRVDGRTGAELIGQGVGAVAGGMRDIARMQVTQAEAEAAITRMQEARAQDQARVRVAHRLAQSRVDAEEELRRMRMNAEDGAEGLTQQFEVWFTGHEQEVREEMADSPWATQILEENWTPFRIDALDLAAQAELDEGRRFRVDRTAESIRLAASSILSNPDSFGRVVAEQRGFIAGLRDIYPHERRDLFEALETEAASAAVVGLINRDPYAARRLLQNPPDVSQIIRNEDGSISTERLITVEADGRFVNIPTIVNGEDVGPERAAELFAAGQLEPVGGSFSTQGMAEAFARDRSAGRGPEVANNPLSYLSAARIDSFLNQANAEIDRREARARAELSSTLQLQESYLENGLPVENLISVDRVRRVFGEQRAQAWALQIAASEQYSGLSTLTNGQLAEIVATPRPGGDASADEILMAEARRTAATRILEGRQDPAAYLLRQGVSEASGLAGAFSTALTAEGEQQTRAWASFDSLLRQRWSAASEGSTRYGIDTRILTDDEAEFISRTINAMPAQAREAFFQRARRALITRPQFMGPLQSQGYDSLVRQLAGGSSTTAYAGWIYGLGRSEARGDALTSERDARLILRGEDILRRVDTTIETPTAGGGTQSRRQVSALVMPDENLLRERWEDLTGSAYNFTPEAGEAAYQVFRAHYAASIEEAGETSGQINRSLARRSIRAATGGIAEWGDGEVVMPWGWTEERFDSAVARAWPRVLQAHPDLEGTPPREMDLVAIGNGRYALMLHGTPMLDGETGEPIEMQIGGE